MGREARVRKPRSFEVDDQKDPVVVFRTAEETEELAKTAQRMAKLGLIVPGLLVIPR